MPSPAKPGQNCILSKGATPIAQTRNLRFTQTARVLDASVHGTDKSTAKIPSLIDRKVMGDLCALPHSSHSGLIADANDQSTDSYSLTWPDTAVISFDAFISELNFSSPHDGMFEGSFTLEVDGAPSWA